MKAFVAALVLSSCALCRNAAGLDPSLTAACGPRDVAFKILRDDTQHPTPAPGAGKAMLYVFGSGYGFGSKRLLGMDGNWLGAVGSGLNYFAIEIDPGTHHFCAQSSARTGPITLPFVFKVNDIAFHSLDAKAGETYYVNLQLMGSNARLRFRLLDPDQGKFLLSRSRFSTSQPK